MENSRRPFDRSRQQLLKKPRLADQAAVVAAPPPDRSSNGRNFPQRPPATATAVAGSRFRGIEREKDSDSVNEPYEPQEMQLPHEELVSQYRTALAELTVNSKPIITNLTIIAGENSHAAKGIAATICKNIIEVPRDQKLPSLYLLDSIVKNLGKDYIKHFAPKLPEVFCKTYKQVDPSIHSGMRHLFGTWKGVFPPRTLQLIEKELGLSPTVNGSSSGTATLRPDSQAQRPASIHVNPKYLEARQRLQQSTRAKGASNNISGTLVESPEDSDRPGRPAGVSSGRPRTDSTVKNIRHVDQEQLNKLGSDKKISTPYGDSEYNFDISRRPGLGERRTTEKLIEQEVDKSWYDSGGSVTAPMSNQNGFNVKHGYQSYLSHKSPSLDALVHPKVDIANKNSSEMSRSWKNSEEEEYMWDDISTRSTEYGTVSSSAKDHWMPDDSEGSDFEIRFRKPQRTQDLGSRADSETSADSLYTEQKDQAAFGHRMQSLWSQEPHLSDQMRRAGSDRHGLASSESYTTPFSRMSSTPNSTDRTSFQSQLGPAHIENSGFMSSKSATLGTTRPVGQQKHALGATSPSEQSPIYQRPPVQSFSEQAQTHIGRRADPRTSQFSGDLNVGLRDQMSQNVHLSNSQRLQAFNKPNSSSAMPSLQMRHHHSIQEQQTEPFESASSGTAQEPVSPQIPGFGSSPTMMDSSSNLSSPLRAESPRQSTTSSLLAAVIKSGILDSNSIISRIPKPSSNEIGIISSQAGLQPSLPRDPRQYASSGGGLTPASIPSPTLPRGSSPSSLVGSASTQPSDAMNSISNPVSSLLSSLVSKGLITASKTDSPTFVQPRISSEPKKPNSRAPSTVAAPKSSLPVSSVTPPSFSSNEIFSVQSAPKPPDSLPQSTTAKITNLIGLEFRPDIIRELHPEVINELLGDLPHLCSICGLQFKLKDRLDRHLQWHELRSAEHNGENKLSRKWYANSICLVDGTTSSMCSSKTIGPQEGSDGTSEDDKQMVPADESQFVCIMCGELFEDFYSQERDEWMFKGAVYMNIPNLDFKSGNTSNLASPCPIVHATCSTQTSDCDLRPSKHIKQEKST